VYYLTLGDFNISSKIKTNEITLYNIATYVKKYNFENTLVVKCIEDGKRCLVYADDVIVEELKNLFEEKPTVYTYDKKLDTISYDDIELKQLDRYEVCFEFSINKYKKYKDMIVEVNNKVYIFNSFYDKPIQVEYISDVSDYFDDMEQKLKDAI